MSSVPDTEGFLRDLLENRDQWPVGFPDVDLSEVLTEWAYQRHIECGINTHRGDIARVRSWAGIGRHGVLPIGLEAIRSHGYLKALYPYSPDIFDRLALLPGDEHLYLPVSGMVNDTHVELLFLARFERTDPFGGEWVPGDMACRLTGYPEDPGVERLLKNARHWWRHDMGGMPLPRGGGRRRNPISSDNIRSAYRALRDSYPDLEITKDTVAAELGVSTKTIDRRLNESGDRWPPVE